MTLTAVTIALAVLAILIAVVAIWGYHGIRKEACSIAEATAKLQMKEMMDGTDIPVKLREEIERRVSKEADALWSDLTMPLSFPSERRSGDQQGTVGKQYPGKEEKL